MAVLKKANSILQKFKRDESGMATLSWALSLTAIIAAMGAAMDFAVLSNADARSQTIADNTALAAAIYVKTNGRAPEREGELVEGVHKASDLGYDYKNFVVNGADGVKVEIDYDDNAKEVTTTVYGQTNPILMQILGFSELDFKAKSVVSYLNIEDKFPASIALVLDNSGSMQFDDKLAVNIHNVTHRWTCTKYRTVRRPAYNRWGQFIGYREQRLPYRSTCSNTHEHGERADGARVRLDGLKESVVQFQTDLRARLGEEDDSGRKTLRMGMLPYSSAIISAGEQPMDWGYLNEGNINHVNNNANPSDDVDNAQGIYGMKADGGTNSSPPMGRAKEWLEAEDGHHTEEARRTQTVDKEPLKFVIFMTDGQNTVGNWLFTPGRTGQWHQRQSDGSYRSRDTPANGYTEGTARLLSDEETIENCTAMKNDGVQIFTIGYALEEFGKFRVNGWDNREHDSLFTVSESIQTAAYNLIRDCATSEDHFIRAADANELEAAFDEIQNAIVEELIRIKA